MLSHTIKNVYVIQNRIDFRKGYSSLLAYCYSFSLDPFSGDCVVFIHHTRKIIKIICGDSYGAWLLIRRFENGKLEEKIKFLFNPSFMQISVTELTMLLDGY